MTDERWGFIVPFWGTANYYYGPYDTREEAETDAVEECKRHSSPGATGYVIGRLIRYSPYLSVDAIYDYLYEDAEEQLGTSPDGYLAPDDDLIWDQIYAKRDDLAKCVSDAIRAWMDENDIATDRLVMERDPEFVEVGSGGLVAIADD